MHILLLEDDPVLSKEIIKFLLTQNIHCDHVYDGSLFLRNMKNRSYDLFLLDINVPMINGLEVCRTIRAFDQQTPIMMLTAYSEIDDKVSAFEMGADDYLVKPFHLTELLIRVNALIKRKDIPVQVEEIFKIGDLTIHVNNKTVERDAKPIDLSPKEFKLLLILAKANGRVVSKQQIADDLWDYNIETTNNTIEVYINFLRKKIDKEHELKLIHTKPGYGYYLKKE